MSQYDLMLDIKIKVGHLFNILWVTTFNSSVIFPYILKTIWCINMIPWANESVWLGAWLQTKRWSLWPIFHGSVIIPQHMKYVEGYIVFVFPSVHLSFHASVLHCDLYFMAPNFEEVEGANRFPPVCLSIHLSPTHTTLPPPHPPSQPPPPPIPYSPPPPKKKGILFPINLDPYKKHCTYSSPPSPPRPTNLPGGHPPPPPPPLKKKKIFSSPEPLAHGKLLPSANVRRQSSGVNNCFKRHLLWNH